MERELRLRREVEHLLHWDGIGLFRSPADKGDRNAFLLEVPYTKLIRRMPPINYPVGIAPTSKQKPNARLVSLLDEARQAQLHFENHHGQVPAELGAHFGRDGQYFKKVLKLNYLAPDILISIREGTQPHHLTRRHLTDVSLPLDWELQRKLLGFPSPAAAA